MSASYGYQQGSFNRLTSTQQTSYSFDSNGNMTSKSEGNDKWYYFYDRENRLVNATKFGGLMPRAGQSVGYQYDALGRRVVRQDKKTGRTEFTHDGMDVIQDRFEKSDGTNSTTSYINGLGIDNKLKVTSGTTSKYFLTDHLGSTVGMADSSGTVTESASYDSFGNKTGSLSTRYQYTGREQDEATGLMYYRARFYDPQVGRFTSEDPIGFEGGDVNLYAYVGNNPLHFNDPFGLSPDANKKLAKCYANALIAYRQGTSQHNYVTIGAKKVSPFASIGAIVSGARGFVNPTSKLPVTTQHLWGNTLVSRYAPLINWGTRLRGAVGGALRTSGNPAARVTGLVALGSGLIVEGTDQFFGTEAFLRQAVAECNAGNQCATEKVESGALTVIGGFFGFGFANSVQGYIDNNE